MRHATHSSRRGTSLLELLVVMGVAGFLLGTGTLFLHRLLSIERTFALQTRTQLTLSRLSERWREDAHQANQVELLTATAVRRQIRFLHDDREFLWTWENGRLEREALREKQRLAWNDFLFTPRTDVNFEFDKAAKIIGLKITRPWPTPLTNSEQTTYEKEAPSELRIEAYGRNLKP